LDTNRTMDNVEKHNICTNVPSSQTFRSYLLIVLISKGELKSVRLVSYSSEVLVRTQQTAQYHNAEDHNVSLHRHGNLKYYDMVHAAVSSRWYFGPSESAAFSHCWLLCNHEAVSCAAPILAQLIIVLFDRSKHSGEGARGSVVG
jgi:hypothetical protein